MTTPRVRSLSTLVAAALVALLIGSVGTATAGPGLTKKAVAKIAAKVVKKQAPRLTVKNATRLDGRPASAYQDTATVFSVDITAASASHEITIPLDAGDYLIAYSVYLAGGSASSLCLVERNRSGSPLFTADEGYQGFGPSMSATGFVDVRAGDVVTLTCSSGTPWTTAVNEPVQIIATRLDAVTHVPSTIS
jgi:hypothetical protein